MRKNITSQISTANKAPRIVSKIRQECNLRLNQPYTANKLALFQGVPPQPQSVTEDTAIELQPFQ